MRPHQHPHLLPQPLPRADVRRRAPLLASLGVALCGALAGGYSFALESPDTYPQSALEIRSATGRQWFTIRIADTDARQEQGLMFVRSLPTDQGMLFPMAEPHILNFWMKNTLIPLDLLFITTRGRIACIVAMAKPLALDLITCPKPAKAVLEIAGGESAKRGIKVGDSVRHAIFHR